MSNLILHNKNNNIYKDFLRFIDTLGNSKYLVLYYENQKFGKKLQFIFIKNGLLKGENCIYITHGKDNALIVCKLINNNINF